MFTLKKLIVNVLRESVNVDIKNPKTFTNGARPLITIL